MNRRTGVLARQLQQAAGRPMDEDVRDTERKQLRVLDLFAGTGSATQPFADRGHQVYRIEREERFDANLYIDVLDIQVPLLEQYVPTTDFDFVWASPPCTSFSVGSFRHHWEATAPCADCDDYAVRVSGEKWDHQGFASDRCDNPKPGERLRYKPKSETGELGQALLQQTMRIIERIVPHWWIIENPRALMRKMPELANVERRTITHCQYGDPRRMKPTDLFGVFPEGFEARACKNGAPCHEAAPRGAKTGTQGLDKTESAMLPPDLGLELCLAMEQEMARA